METQAIVAELVGALIFAIPLTARAYNKRSDAVKVTADANAKKLADEGEAEKKIAAVVEAAVAALRERLVDNEARLARTEGRLSETEAKHAKCESDLQLVKKQSDADQVLIANLAGKAEEDSKIIDGMRNELNELNRMVTGVRRTHGT